MSVVNEIGEKLLAYNDPPKLDKKGHKVWGMRLLSERCGLSRTQIGNIFGVSRQTIDYHLGKKMTPKTAKIFFKVPEDFSQRSSQVERLKGRGGVH